MRQNYSPHEYLGAWAFSFFDLSFNNFLPLAEALLLVPVGNDLNILKADIRSL